MQNTCDYPSCPFAKLQEQMCDVMGVKHNFPQQCPNYLESIWKEKETQEEKLIRDCSPRRTIISVRVLFDVLQTNTSEIGKLKSEQENLKVIAAYAIKQISSQTGEQEKRISCKDTNIQS